MTARVLIVLALAMTACADTHAGRQLAARLGIVHPAYSPPLMLNAEPPFRYPPALWAQREQGNVTLRLYIDSTGRAVSESTTIAAPSGVAAFDSAARAGVPSLRFRPARVDGTAVGVVLLLPVFFRHPDAPPLPGDTVLKRTPAAQRRQ